MEDIDTVLLGSFGIIDATLITRPALAALVQGR
jgi:hypothetical protein